MDSQAAHNQLFEISFSPVRGEYNKGTKYDVFNDTFKFVCSISIAIALPLLVIVTQGLLVFYNPIFYYSLLIGLIIIILFGLMYYPYKSGYIYIDNNTIIIRPFLWEIFRISKKKSFLVNGGIDITYIKNEDLLILKKGNETLEVSLEGLSKITKEKMFNILNNNNQISFHHDNEIKNELN
jgi:hypothetical protein